MQRKPLHHTAHVQRAQLGAYMCWKGLNSVKMPSEWAHFTCLCTTHGLGSLLEKRVFDPVLTHVWSHDGPFSRHFGLFHGPQRVIPGSKWAKNTSLSSPNGPRSLLEKCIFDPFLTHFWSQNGPFLRHFGIFHGPKRATTGSKRPKNTCVLCEGKVVCNFLELGQFGSPNSKGVSKGCAWGLFGGNIV